MNKDLTILYATAGKVKPVFAENVRRELLKSAGDYPIISLSKEPLDFGTNIVDAGKSSINNYYHALLNGARIATTPYIAICEDDALYPDEHFNYRPELDTFAYNFTRWNIFPWSEPPFFHLKQRKIITTLICSRELFIEAFEERFTKYAEPPVKWMGEPGRTKYEQALGVTERKSEEFNTYNPIVVFSHEDSFGYETTGKNKRADKIRALELPYFGKASDVMKLYKESNENN